MTEGMNMDKIQNFIIQNFEMVHNNQLLADSLSYALRISKDSTINSRKRYDASDSEIY